ncbi:MAG: phosphatase PAP2 family protein [Candidatus Eisenbacteria bacterium]|uniref:Phosphatase PAP2 family protein n=1 Tax=Eiseniibacteriota bacterium TaxID=2212470 RepID=A0A948W617_UNCEI|nr:phosphatase PAP2 family protein [Candidatus Eisenbacteria bacterium]MBU1950776.1 phosphatase PAP2 family protein [Candidatus Eisenbacteria bacterium]MBU2690161.1 phosphatase PAP2 family protein [Candidatus Eisenbacteria bacterium]
MVSRFRLALKKHLSRTDSKGYTPIDAVTLAYLIFTALFLLIAPHHPAGWLKYLLIHLGALGLVASLRYIPRPRFVPLMFLRDAYPLLAMPLMYGELQFLNQILANGYYDAVIIPIENLLFRTQPAIYLRGWLPSLALSEYLHLSYLLYIGLIPFCGIVFYIKKRYENFRIYVTTVLLTFFLCYVAFIVFPVAGPYYAFPRPDPKMIGLVFPEFVHWMLDRGASLGSAFPSSHVAVAVASLLVVFPLDRKLFWIILPVVAGITVGVVYGGFHYALDAIVGSMVGAGVGLLGPGLYQEISDTLKSRAPER